MQACEVLHEPGFESPLARNRKLFAILCGTCVVLGSFIYGLSLGFSKQLQPANAALGKQQNGSVFGELGDLPPQLTNLPDGIKIIPMGNDVTINGKAVALTSFVTSRNIKGLMQEQVSKWEALGFITFGATTEKKGIAVAFNKETGERWLISAQLIPAPLRAAVSYGYAVQGKIAMAAAVGGEVERPDERTGVIPGVPLMPGGQGGAVWSSEEAEGRGYSGVYTNPGTVLENVEYYAETLVQSGWDLQDKQLNANVKKPFAQLSFRRDREELVLFVVPAEGPKDISKGKTVVTVALSPAPFGPSA